MLSAWAVNLLHAIEITRWTRAVAALAGTSTDSPSHPSQTVCFPRLICHHSILSSSPMPPKRMRRASPAPAGLSAGERLKRTKLAGSHSYSAWGWVGTEVTDALDITQEHLLATCGFSKNSPHPLCANKYAVCPKVEAPRRKSQKAREPKAEGELEDDVIVISDDDAPSCSNKGCKSNPYCLNYLGQEKWENEGEGDAVNACAMRKFEPRHRQSSASFHQGRRSWREPCCVLKRSRFPCGSQGG